MKKIALLPMCAAFAWLAPAHLQAQTAPAAPAAQAPAAAPAAPPPILPFDTALVRAAVDLFSKAQLPPGDAKVQVVIDPLIDGVSGTESRSTREMELRLVNIMRSNFPRFEVLPFNTTSVQRQPIVLVGTFTAVNNAGQPTGTRDAYRICLAMADLKTNKIVAKGTARADPKGIDHSPTPVYTDAPVMGKDPAVDAYVKTCQGTPLGNTVDAGYTEKIMTAALIADAVKAYDSGRYGDALTLYTRARSTPTGDQLRVHNGMYLASIKLGRTGEATKAFGELADYGVKSGVLNVRFLFRPGSQSYIANQAVNKQYPMWVNQIAEAAARTKACMEIVGHTSKTGPEPVNQRLSVLRAEAIRDQLASSQKSLADRLLASGVGSSQTLVGTGKDDASDALDRRVEFKVIKC